MPHFFDEDDAPVRNGTDVRQTVLEERIAQKIVDYDHYKFTVRQTRALNIFFDLAQEYEDLRYLYSLPVQVLQFFFKVRAELYARDETGAFSVQTTKVGPEAALPDLEEIASAPRCSGPWWFFPVKGRPGGRRKASGRAGQPVSPGKEEPFPRDEREVLAILAILPAKELTEHERLFYEKFANRLGFNLHNRMLALKNLDHIEFVRTLVHDIGHNVIVPNLHFKLLMRQMAEKITALRRLSDNPASPEGADAASLRELCDKIETHYDEISKHFHQSSFFLETLLRQSHFDEGRYVLQRTRFNLAARVVAPQFERYALRFQERGISVEERYDGAVSSLLVDADVGLLSQVVANFLSNAVKYTRPRPGGTQFLARCSVRLLPDRFGPGKDGIAAEVLSTGPPIVREEAERLFTENFRASNTGEEQGTGHGLYFSRLIIARHGGESGYRREEEGNVFYFILPVFRENGAAGPEEPDAS
ncbi:MAG: HAMP domain-containing histidine kinase [Deltaproteobacteria bacterium]|jgi:signal transduction histidine kinase|nr:HAMP domain-containing histidine kinase [Deltaproteobacteria bacterium]